MSFEQFAEAIRATHLRYALHEWHVEQNEKAVLAEIDGGGKIPAPVLFDNAHQLARVFFPAHAAAVSASRSISTSKFGEGECPSFSARVIPARLPIRTRECSFPSI